MAMKKVIASALAGVVAVGLTGVASQAMAASAKMEKCYGVVKSGKNDCGTAKHSCAGQAKADGNKSEWIYLPKGTCDKLVGGSTTKDANGDSAS